MIILWNPPTHGRVRNFKWENSVYITFTFYLHCCFFHPQSIKGEKPWIAAKEKIIHLEIVSTLFFNCPAGISLGIYKFLNLYSHSTSHQILQHTWNPINVNFWGMKKVTNVKYSISFSNLFGPSPKKPAPPMVSIRYNSPQGEGESSPSSRRSNSSNSGSTGSIAVASGGGFGSEKWGNLLYACTMSIQCNLDLSSVKCNLSCCLTSTCNWLNV